MKILNKLKLILSLQGLILVAITNSCGSTSTSVNDIEGNNYKTIQIGKQVWMAENLNVSKFSNGDPILEAKTDEEWMNAAKLRIPAWCNYENDPVSGKKYGKLYNWFAVNDSRGLAPQGWKIPSDEEWLELMLYLSPEAGYKMKHIIDWGNDYCGSNISGFSGLPAGIRCEEFGALYEFAFWWGSDEKIPDELWAFELYRDSDELNRGRIDKYCGISVRCIKIDSNPEVIDNFYESEVIHDSFIDARDGKVYRSVKLGSQVWMAENLNYFTTSGSWCYEEKNNNCNKYGRIYNWETALAACPLGWHLPSKNEWSTLIKHLDSNSFTNQGGIISIIAGGKLKSTSTSPNPHPRWDYPNTGANNKSGFSALPGGYKMPFSNDYEKWGRNAIFWSSTESQHDDIFAFYYKIEYNNRFLTYSGHSKMFGLSVRCLRD